MGGDARRVLAHVHLQWFAAEDEGRTEEPSEYKLRKAREEGRVAKSPDLVSAIGLLLTSVTFAIIAPWWFGNLRDMLAWFLSVSTELDPVTDSGLMASAFFGYFIKLSLPLGIVGVAAAIFGNVLQIGLLFTVKPITPDFKRIVPRFGQFLQKTVFSIEGLFNLAKSIVKIAIIGGIAWTIVQAEMDRLLVLFAQPFWISLKLVGGMALKLVIATAVALLAFSVPDFLFQRRQFTEQMKMSLQEVKEERKMYEGDPTIKGRLRERMRELLTKNMAANVPKADVVVTNPTHYAVALEWNRETMVAPTVTAKGADEVALRIRKLASDNDVPIVENRPLARALYADVEIGQVIPDKYYQAIATVLSHVYAMRPEKARWTEAEAEAAAAGAEGSA
ncbi:MAG: flagellar biosynthesis protein FlhB [Spirochaetes bacterium]|nr:flagellar biosynthesis protein FlhB [Spirochaetota bacterium]